jgi:GcrA cell cycle regulator
MGEVPVGWTEERVARLRRMIAEGGSAAAIAEALGGVTRNGVIGKAHRLNLNFGLPPGGEGVSFARQAKAGAAVPNRAAPRQKAARPAPAPKPAPLLLRPAPVVAPTPKLWPKPAGPEACELGPLDMAKQCRMPLWGDEAKGGLYCGKPMETEGKPWCAACARLVYDAPPRLSPLELMIARRRAANGQSARSGAFA